MTIYPDDVPDFLALFENFDCTPRSYSGRGMYGKECLAVTSDCDEAEFIYDCGARGAPCPKTDSMGKGTVFYWPSIRWAEWEEARTYHEDTEE